MSRQECQIPVPLAHPMGEGDVGIRLPHFRIQEIDYLDYFVDLARLARLARFVWPGEKIRVNTPCRVAPYARFSTMRDRRIAQLQL